MLAILELAVSPTMFNAAYILPRIGNFFINGVDMSEVGPNKIDVSPVLGVEILLFVLEDGKSSFIGRATDDHYRCVFEVGRVCNRTFCLIFWDEVPPIPKGSRHIRETLTERTAFVKSNSFDEIGVDDVQLVGHISPR